MNNKHIELDNVGDLHCDTVGCDYQEPVLPEDYTKYINKPCPKCGANLLTYEDYMRFQASLSAIEMINSMTEEELKELSQIEEISKKADEIAKMMEGFDINDLVKVSVSTHNEIKIESIEKVNSEPNAQVCDATKDDSSNAA
jgi:predicted  nucleic acid-binding Zn-ribbon protein